MIYHVSHNQCTFVCVVCPVGFYKAKIEPVIITDDYTAKKGAQWTEAENACAVMAWEVVRDYHLQFQLKIQNYDVPQFKRCLAVVLHHMGLKGDERRLFNKYDFISLCGLI